MKIRSTCSDTIRVADIYQDTSMSQDGLFMTIGYRMAQWIDFGGRLTLSNFNQLVNPKIGQGICVKSLSNEKSLISKIISRLPEKSISFWVDTSVTQADVDGNSRTRTGEVVFGGVNPNRFVKDTAKSFELVYLNDRIDPVRWNTNQLVILTVGTFPKQSSTRVVFDIGSPNTILPPEIYNVVVGPVKFLQSGNQLNRKQNLPADVVGLIEEFSGPISESLDFPCAQAHKLQGFKLDDLEIPREMLYDKVDENTCVLRVAPHQILSRTWIEVGFHLIKRFHLEIKYDQSHKSYAVFSERKSRQDCSGCCVIC